MSLTTHIKESALKNGADLVGVADLELLRGIETEPEDLFAPFKRAVSIAVRLSDGIVDRIEDVPTALYQQHYLKVNALLDAIALKVSRRIEAEGFVALPIPASQVLDKSNWTSYISHKAVAIAAGVGWQGKSLLVVNPRHGPRIRLVTVLTDAELEADAPLKNLCAACSACSDACPAGAIRNVNTSSHYANRNEALDFDKCVHRVSVENTQLPFIESPICGVCIRACPFGAKKAKK